MQWGASGCREVQVGAGGMQGGAIEMQGDVTFLLSLLSILSALFIITVLPVSSLVSEFNNKYCNTITTSSLISFPFILAFYLLFFASFLFHYHRQNDHGLITDRGNDTVANMFSKKYL